MRLIEKIKGLFSKKESKKELKKVQYFELWSVISEDWNEEEKELDGEICSITGTITFKTVNKEEEPEIQVPQSALRTQILEYDSGKMSVKTSKSNNQWVKIRRNCNGEWYILEKGKRLYHDNMYYDVMLVTVDMLIKKDF